MNKNASHTHQICFVSGSKEFRKSEEAKVRATVAPPAPNLSCKLQLYIKHCTEK